MNNPNPKFVVDGHTYPNPDSDLAGDGENAPFYILNTDKQEYLPGRYPTRNQAQIVANGLIEHYR